MDKEQIRKHVLVVDDDDRLRELVIQYLGDQGFDVAGVPDATAMDEFLADHTVDLIVLDLMLPGEDGLSIARRIRNSKDIPIIILSARGDDVDRIVGLEVGADDYLPKPFNPRELLARIRAILRRADHAAVAEPEADSQAFSFGQFRLNLQSHCLMRGDEPVDLTHGDLALLEVFVSRPNRVMSRDNLLQQLKGYERSPFDRSIDVRVTRLRKKIETDATNPEYIRTVWGKGYMFTPQGNTG